MKPILLLLTIILFASCSQSKKMNQELSLYDIWALVELKGNSYQTYEGERPTIEIFTDEKRINGNTGCNNYFGSIMKLEDNKIQFGEIGATRMACMRNTAEQDFLDMITKVDSYKLKDLQLYFYNESGNVISTFKKVD